jgi:predicted nucleic-acid-binding Zn-ribbon protein
MSPKCPKCDGTSFLAKSVNIPAEPGGARIAFSKHFVYCDKCGAIVSEYNDVQNKILEKLDAINDNILAIEKNTHPRHF